MLVKSHDHFDDLATFDPASGHLMEFKRKAGEEERVTEDSPAGRFAALSDTIAVFYRDGDLLWLRLGQHARELHSGRSSVLWERSGSRAWLRLLDGPEEVTSVEYVPGPTSGSSLEDDPTPFVEPEDWDFGLFVRNVLADAGRARRIYSQDAST